MPTQRPEMGYLCATQVFEANTGPWGNPLGAAPCLAEEGVGTQSSTNAFICCVRH